MKRGVFALWGLVLLAVAGVIYLRTRAEPRPIVSAEAASSANDASVWPDTPVVNFDLVDAAGEPFSSAELKDKVWVASFFFVDCPGFCLKLNERIAELAKDLADTDVRFVSMTVDPMHDTPEVMTEYTKRYQADPKQWTFLTGDPATIERVAGESFKVSAAPATHTGRLMLVDRDGRVQGAYSYSSSAEMAALKKKARELADRAASTEEAS
jgi:protein SCO1/2